MRILALVILVIAAGGHAHAQSVERVIDGNSVVIDGKTLRLWGIRAPSDDEPLAAEARDALARLVAQGVARVEATVDRRVMLVGSGGQSLNYLMVHQGWARPIMARADPQYPAFEQARENAAMSSKGIWRAGIAPPDRRPASTPPNPAAVPPQAARQRRAAATERQADDDVRKTCGRDYQRVAIGMRFARVQQCSGGGPFRNTEKAPWRDGTVSTFENSSFLLYVVNGEVIGWHNRPTK